MRSSTRRQRHLAGVASAVAVLALLCVAPPPAVGADSMTPARLEALLETYRGKVVLVDYWATWCPPCRSAAPELNRLYLDVREQGVEIIGVSFDRDEGPLRQFIARHELKYPIYRGTEGLKLVQGISVLPTTVLIAGDGTEVGRYLGYLTRETLETKIRALLAQGE